VAAPQREGMPCPRCANPKSYVYGRRVGCIRCGRRWSVATGAVIANTKMPLTTCFPKPEASRRLRFHAVVLVAGGSLSETFFFPIARHGVVRLAIKAP
jgi:hypothetical protein